MLNQSTLEITTTNIQRIWMKVSEPSWRDTCQATSLLFTVSIFVHFLIFKTEHEEIVPVRNVFRQLPMSTMPKACPV